MADLQSRLAKVEDIESIRCLKAHYADLCDEGYDADALVALFTPDGEWDGGKLGCFEGRNALHKFFSGMPKTLSFAVHHLTNSAIRVNDARTQASARWYLLQTATLASDGTAVWLAGRYEDQLLRGPEGWRFRSMKIHARFFTTHAAGWGELPFLSLTP
jgi:hypothetical protein